jgi:TPR repeat protein
MTKSLKLTLAALLLFAVVLAYVLLTRPSAAQPAAWDGAALLAKAEQSLEGLPAKEAAELRALLTSTGPGRYDDRAGAWIKTATKDDLKAVADYAVASLRAMAEAGDAAAMWHLHYVLVMRIATADEGFRWLDKAAKQGYPQAIFDVTKQQLKDQPEKLRAAMEEFSKQENDAGLQALYWFAYGYEKGKDGLPKDAAKAEDYRNRAKALGDKLQAVDKAK